MEELKPTQDDSIEMITGNFFPSVAQRIHTIASEIVFEQLNNGLPQEQPTEGSDPADENIFTTKQDLQKLADAFPDWMKDKRKRFDRLYRGQKE